VPPEEEFDTKDLGATHFVLIEDGDVVAILRRQSRKRRVVEERALRDDKLALHEV
jgi:hypothetical protein